MDIDKMLLDVEVVLTFKTVKLYLEVISSVWTSSSHLLPKYMFVL